MFHIIANLQFYGEFREAIQRASSGTETIESVEQKLKRLRADLRDAEVSKNRLGDKLDGLNPLKADYDRKYQQVSDELDKAYDRIDELEEAIREAKESLGGMKKKASIGDSVISVLNHINLLIRKMTPQEKKELCGSFIDRIDLFPEERSDGRLIRSISFKIPLVFEGKDMKAVKDTAKKFLFTLDCTGIDIKLPEKGSIEMKTMPDGSRKATVRKGTYQAIKAFVTERFGVKVSTLYIAQTKRKYGLDMGKAYNKPADTSARVPKCTPEKEKMILEALKYYGLLPEDVKYMEDKDHDKH